MNTGKEQMPRKRKDRSNTKEFREGYDNIKWDKKEGEDNEQKSNGGIKAGSNAWV